MAVPAIDTRIPLAGVAPKINTPNENRLQALAIQGDQMKLDEARRGIQQQNALAGLLQRSDAFDAQGGINPSLLPEVARVAPGQALGFSKAIQGQRKALSDAQKAQLDQAKTQLDLVGRLLGGVTDENSYQAARMQAQQLGIPLTGVPDRFDPAWVQQQVQSTLTYKDQLDQIYRQQGIDIQRERLDLERTAPRGQVVDTAEGVMIVDPRSGASRPAVAAGGQPVMGQRAAEAERRSNERRIEAIEAQQAVDNSAANLDRLSAEARSIMNDPALKRITGPMGILPNWPGGAAADVQARLETLKSQAGFAVLQAMRDASKTGGALGNVSNFEVQALQNNLAALDTSQSPEAFIASLQRIIDYADGVKTRMGEAYTRQFGATQPATPAQSGVTAAPAAASLQLGHVEDGWEYVGGDPGNPQSWRRAGG